MRAKKKAPPKKPEPQELPRKARVQVFLAVYRKTALISRAAEQAGIDTCTHFRRLKRDPEYAEKFRQAHEEAMAMVEQAAIERATHGTQEPVFYKGRVCGHITRYSDGLMQFILRGQMPETYGTRAQLELSGPDAGPVRIEGLGVLTDDELELLIRVRQKLAAAAAPRGGEGEAQEEQDGAVLSGNGAVPP